VSTDSRKIYSSARWQKIRAQVLRDEPVCHWCHRRPATEADHLIELARGGDPFERSNLVGACKPCNSARGSAMQAKQNARRKQPAVFKSGKIPTWNIGADVIFDAYRPAMIARPSPLLSMWSTAGDESSKVMMQLREQGLRSIEDDQPTTLCFMEWSPPPGADTSNPATWRWSNPALGTTITMEALKGASNTPDKQAFLRAHCNVWVSSSNAWLPHDLWDQLRIDQPMPAGGVLAVDNDLDDLRYVGVRAVRLDDGRIQVGTEFVATSAEEMWQQLETAMADPQLQLALTPGLADLAPTKYARRLRTVGGQELYKYTSLVRNACLEKQVCHNGQLALSEHVNRAVAARSQNALTLSSMKSPGPIELARCMVWAVGIAAKPVSAIRVAQMGSSVI
jgi:hypothetical protein